MRWFIQASIFHFVYHALPSSTLPTSAALTYLAVEVASSKHLEWLVSTHCQGRHLYGIDTKTQR